MLLRSVVHEVFNTYLILSSIKKLFFSDTMHDYNFIVCLFICVSLCVIIISVVCAGRQVPIFSYFFLFFSAYSYFSYFLAISSYFSYFLAILLTVSKYLLEI